MIFLQSLVMRTHVLLVLFLLLWAGCTAEPATNITVPALFSDHMVLQRDRDVPVWGTADPGGRVTVTLGDRQTAATAGPDGRWQATLPPMPAGGPHTLTIAGAETLTFEDVLIGEVWVASGQSNMEWSVENSNDAAAEIAAANYPRIRLFDVRHTVSSTPLDSVAADGWRVTSPQTIPSFSAVAYFFGRTLHEALDVPIGLISTNWGGTRAEAWTSRDGLATFPEFQPYLAQLDSFEVPLQALQAHLLARYQERIQTGDAGYQADVPWFRPEADDADWATMTLPTLWEQAGLDGLDGVVWFRRTVDLPAGWAAEDLTLYLGAIDDADSTWVNGVLVGHTNSYNTERVYTVPASALRPGRNVISVRVVDTGGGGGIYGEAAQLRLARASGASRSLAGPWRYRVGVRVDDLQPPLRLQDYPTALYNGMIAPLIPYAIQGAIWYQGESNADRAYQYRDLFPAMIRDWRQHWGQGDFPFYFVQLANFMAPQTDPNEASAWAELREAQLMTLALPNTGMAVTIDIGEADDIHPRNKQDVGYRLAQWALAETYGRADVVPSGPLYRSMTKENGAIRLAFDHVGGGLTTPDGAPLRGFAVAGADRRFVWADARIDGNTVVVSSRAVADPVAVRYGWANNPAVNLYNAEGLPASPFRTDDWPGVTVNNRTP